MAEVVTYKNTATMCFYQVRFETGERVLISISGGTDPTIDIRRLGRLGLFPKESIWKYSCSIAGSPDAYVRNLAEMFADKTSTISQPLDAFRDHLLSCSSIESAKQALKERSKHFQ